MPPPPRATRNGARTTTAPMRRRNLCCARRCAGDSASSATPSAASRPASATRWSTCRACWSGHRTLVEGDRLRTGVTAILPHGGNLYAEKVLGACHTINGYGKAAGLSQLAELGTIESPLLLTSTLSVGPVWEGGLRHMLAANPEAAVDRDTVNVIVGRVLRRLALGRARPGGAPRARARGDRRGHAPTRPARAPSGPAPAPPASATRPASAAPRAGPRRTCSAAWSARTTALGATCTCWSAPSRSTSAGRRAAGARAARS